MKNEVNEKMSKCINYLFKTVRLPNEKVVQAAIVKDQHGKPCQLPKKKGK